jgi:hypothetical protein
MANLPVLDGNGDLVYLKAAGAGTESDPHILDRTTAVSGTVAATQSGAWNVATVTAVTGITNAVAVTDNSGSLTVDGTVAATQSGTWAVGITEKSLAYATGTAALSGDNTLVAAPGANIRLVVTAFTIQNESATATTMILKSASTNRWRVLGQAQGDGLAMTFPVGQGWKLAANEALLLNLSGANSCGYSVQYYTEAA